MYLSHLSLQEFRNYRELDLKLEPGLYLFYGENAQGKTNLLEAMSMLATANSFHASGDREVVNWYAPEHVAHLDGCVKRREDQLQIEMHIFDPNPPAMVGAVPSHRSVELPASVPRKRLKLNSIPRRTMDVIGQMRVVLFAPTDLHLVDGSPEERRRFLDRALCQVHPRYCQAIIQYRKIVAQRAALLKRVRDNQEDPHMLEYLDEQLAQVANMIMYERKHMIDQLNQQAEGIQKSISGGREHLQINYRPSFRMEEGSSLVEAAGQYRQQLQDVRRKEIHQGVCLLGPHRDDLEFIVNDINMLTYGSRGQQRTAALAAKLAELAFMHQSTGDEPVLLLDDVFSELDASRREYLLRQILQHQQVFLTSTDLTGFPQEVIERAHVYHVVDGQICQQK
ncbi:MAG TPA: DNA replication/repair protein RecF [Ktedonobacteraceae bacterium]|jgi:DNA replication and repair protein RecF|nr:DNA replication/repair protein RecF [Ktedonobacteraceae bacterium]